MSERNTLQQEIRQTVPFRSLAQEAAISIQRTADVLTHRFDTGLAPHGVTAQQYNVLRILRGARGKPLKTLEVGERMISRTPGITRMIDRLVDKGLVARERCLEDRRVVFCSITPAGLDLLDRTDALVDRLDERTGEGLEPAELEQLIDLLARIRASGS